MERLHCAYNSWPSNTIVCRCWWLCARIQHLQQQVVKSCACNSPTSDGEERWSTAHPSAVYIHSTVTFTLYSIFFLAIDVAAPFNACKQNNTTGALELLATATAAEVNYADDEVCSPWQYSIEGAQYLNWISYCDNTVPTQYFQYTL